MHTHNGAILGVTLPLLLFYFTLMVIGIGNVLRFLKVKSMSRYLGLIYVWSLLSNLSCGLYLLVCQYPNTIQYPPYMVGVYSKLLLGIAYQASIFDLKYVVNFYF